MLIEFGGEFYWMVGNPEINAHSARQNEGKAIVFAEHLLNNRLQMRASSATGKAVTLTKQIKIGLYEQVRVN